MFDFFSLVGYLSKLDFQGLAQMLPLHNEFSDLSHCPTNTFHHLSMEGSTQKGLSSVYLRCLAKAQALSRCYSQCHQGALQCQAHSRCALYHPRCWPRAKHIVCSFLVSPIAVFLAVHLLEVIPQTPSPSLQLLALWDLEFVTRSCH